MTELYEAQKGLFPERETLTVEFKSDPKGGLKNDVVVDTAVGFANAEGGTLFIGLNDDGSVGGVKSPKWRNPELAVAYIASHSVPPITATAEIVRVSDALEVLAIHVPKATGIVATNDGKLMKRRIKADGTPETSPLFPQEFISRLAEIGRCDYSSMTLPNTTYDDFDANERQRLREFLRDNNGEKALMDLEDEDLDKALGLVRGSPEGLIPTIAGILILGKERRIRQLLPGAGAVFQHLAGTDVLANEEMPLPLLKGFQALLDRFNARNSETEITQGLARIAIPTFSEQAFREALVNAFCHRDYTILNRVSVRLSDDGLEITSPGGFVSGVSLENLLTVEPHPRNGLLADVLKRLGLAERTGRGIDRIFEGNLLYGRPSPDYSESNSDSVRVFFPKCDPNIPFFQLIIEYQKKLGSRISVQSLIVLSAVLFAKRLNFAGIAAATHIPELRLKRHVETLVEDGLLEARGNGRERDFILSPKFYKAQKRVIEHVRQAGIGAVKNEDLIMQLVQEQGNVTRSDVAALLGVNPQIAYRLLKKLVEDGALVREGAKRLSVYRLA
ncbi:ATP-binding protein [Sutterella seckii]|nr:ATP-binding protein [Sutterella seckii]